MRLQHLATYNPPTTHQPPSSTSRQPLLFALAVD
jgi:hypothetical protein